jgi:hypothetical protein
MDIKAVIVFVAVALSLTLVFLGRYALVPVPAGGQGMTGMVYRLDRWTGDVTFIAGPTSGRVDIK